MSWIFNTSFTFVVSSEKVYLAFLLDLSLWLPPWKTELFQLISTCFCESTMILWHLMHLFGKHSPEFSLFLLFVVKFPRVYFVRFLSVLSISKKCSTSVSLYLGSLFYSGILWKAFLQSLTLRSGLCVFTWKISLRGFDFCECQKAAETLSKKNLKIDFWAQPENV